MKTLNQIEPRTLIESLPIAITNPGSYYITANLSVTQNVSGITILTNDVHIDLNGFALIGTGAGTSKAGIYVPAAQRNLKFENGLLKNWGWEGIWAEASSDSFATRVNTVSNSWSGIWLGNGASVENCVAVGNTYDGIRVGANSTVQNCTTMYNKEDGISAGTHSRINDCTAMGNILCGINALGGSRVKGCTSGGNGTYGLVGGDASAIQDCIASSNGTNGIHVTKAVRVIACNARNNDGRGIAADDGSVIRDCLSSLNAGDGIYVTSSCRVENNNCVGNGRDRASAGIHVAAAGNRIENNNVADNNDKGIYTETAGSIVFRNTAHANGSDGKDSDFYLYTGTPTGTILDQLDGPILLDRPSSNFSF